MAKRNYDLPDFNEQRWDLILNDVLDDVDERVGLVEDVPPYDDTEVRTLLGQKAPLVDGLVPEENLPARLSAEQLALDLGVTPDRVAATLSDPAVQAPLDEAIEAKALPRGGAGVVGKPLGDGSPGIVELVNDDTTGYLLHLKTGANSGSSAATIGIGTDKGGAAGLLVSHKNGNAGITLTQQPGSGIGEYLTGFAATPVLWTDIYAKSAGHAMRLRTGQGFSDGVTTAGSAIFTSASAAFTAGDVGQTLSQLTSRGTSDPLDSIPSGATILSVQSATQVTMSAPAPTSATGLMFRVGGRAPAWDQAILTVYDTDGTTVLGLINQAGLDWRAGQVDRPAIKARGKAGQTGNIFEVVINGNATPALQVASSGRVGGAFSASFNNAGATTQNVLQAINFGAGVATLYLQGVAGQTGDQMRIVDSATATQARFDKNGVLMIKRNTAPADADVNTGECAFWFDSTNGAAKLMFKAKQADGTVRTGSVALA